MKKREEIKFLTLGFCIFFTLSKDIQAQEKKAEVSYIMYGYVCSAADTSEAIWGRLYSIEKFSENNRPMSRMVLNEKNDTVHSWDYDKQQRLVKEMNKDELRYYYYSEKAATPDSCRIIYFIKNDFPVKARGTFYKVHPDSVKMKDQNGACDMAAEAMIADLQFPNYPDKKIMFRYSTKEKTISKDEFDINKRTKEELKLSMIMRFNEQGQLVNYTFESFDYGGYNSLTEEFFCNASGKLTHAFGYYKKINKKPDYIICYRYVKTVTGKSK